MPPDDARPVLLLVDLQMDYLKAPGLQPAASAIIERANTLAQGCRIAGVPIIHAWTTISREKDDRMPHWKRQGKEMCIEKTEGHATPISFRRTEGDQAVHKTFFNPFSNGKLPSLLSEHRANTVIIAGVHLHACVREAALSAYEFGCEVWVAEDAVGSDDPVHAAITRRYLEKRAARFAPVADLLEMLQGGKIKMIDDAPFAPVRPPRPKATLPQRRKLLEKWADNLQTSSGKLMEKMAREIGKPVFYGRGEIASAVELLRAMARQEWNPVEKPGMRRRPVGTVAVITPWNNPVLIPLGKIAAAVFFGNAVVWKPSPLAAGLAHELMDLLEGGPVTLLEGNARCAAELMSDPSIDAVSLTGGWRAGDCAQEICARRHIPLQAELGGNNAAIVWPDCDLPEAAARIAEGAFGQAGQRCTANRRVIVHRVCLEKFWSLLMEATAQLPMGDPLHPATRVGPMVTLPERNRVAALIERTAGKVHQFPLKDEPYYPPTIVRCDNPREEIVQEETFGPVLVVQKASDWAQAMALCNGVRQGLAAAIFSASQEIQGRFLDSAQAGILKINESTAGADVHLPFGGWKASGIGPPEHGVADREFYTRIQAIYHRQL